MADNPHRCCDRMNPERIGDCDSVKGFGLTLERCVNCGTYVMDFYYGGSSTYNVVSPGVLGAFKTLRDLVEAELVHMGEDVVER